MGITPAWSRVAKSHRRRTSPAPSSIAFLLIPRSSSSSSLPLLLVHPPKILFTNALWAWAPSATRVNPNYTLVELEWWSRGVGATLQTALGGCVGATGVQSRQHLQSNFCNPLLLLLLLQIQHSESKIWSGDRIFSACVGKTSQTNHSENVLQIQDFWSLNDFHSQCDRITSSIWGYREPPDFTRSDTLHAGSTASRSGHRKLEFLWQDQIPVHHQHHCGRIIRDSAGTKFHLLPLKNQCSWRRATLGLKT